MLLALNRRSSSHARLEKKLNLLIAEVRAGKREGSVVSVQTFNSSAHRDQETWDALRRELEDIGISPGVITEKRQFIIAWFQDAVAAGELEEDVPSEGQDDSAWENAPSEELDDSACVNDVLSDRDEGESSTSPIQTVRYQQPAIAQFKFDLPERRKAVPMRKRVSDLVINLQAPDKQLFKAIHAKDAVRVGLALDKGANLEYKDKNGYSMLSVASSEGSASIVGLLLDRGAIIESRNSAGWTPLMNAAWHGQLEVIRTLLEHGAKLEVKHSYYTPLLAAVRSDTPEAVRLLLEKGANVDSKSEDGRTALMETAHWDRLKVFRELMMNGANIGLKDKSGDTALSIAEKHYNLVKSADLREMIQVLLGATDLANAQLVHI